MQSPSLNDAAYLSGFNWLIAYNPAPKNNAPMNTVTGKVNTQAVNIVRTVFICTPLPLAAIVPATPLVNTCVVLTGKPIMSAVAIVVIATSSADAPCAYVK